MNYYIVLCVYDGYELLDGLHYKRQVYATYRGFATYVAAEKEYRSLSADERDPRIFNTDELYEFGLRVRLIW